MKTKEQIVAKEQLELQKWKLMKNKPVSKWYIPIMVLVISIIYLLDSLATDLHGGLSELQITYFSNQLGLSYDAVLSIFTMIAMLTIVINLIAPFYKSLADRLGRKKLFMISTAGMGVGLLLGFFSTNLVIYIIGRIILTFFVIADIQVIYIMEVAPPEKRARLFSLTKFFSILGVLVIPLCRDLLLDDTGSNWRVIPIVPAIIALFGVLFIAKFIRESDVFLDRRIAYLERPYEERQQEKVKLKTEHQVDTSKANIGTAIKYIIKDKQLRYIIIAYAALLLGMNAFVAYFNTICLKSGMDTQAITLALYMYPLTAALVTLAAGFISDKIGRKKTCVIYAVMVLVSLSVYILSAGRVHPFVIGAFFGITNGGFWVVGDSIAILMAESSKTEIRSSVAATSGFTSLIAVMISSMIFGSLLLVVNLAVLCIVGGTLTMGLTLLILTLKVKETKGTDLERVGEPEPVVE